MRAAMTSTALRAAMPAPMPLPTAGHADRLPWHHAVACGRLATDAMSGDFVAALVGLRGELGFLGEADLGAAGVDGVGERLDEALRRAGDEGELDVDPVGAGGVVDDGPALQGRGLFGGGGCRWVSVKRMR